MEKYGFVYIWYDKKHKRYYIGSHWGTENDGYICSSAWMNLSYKKRPNDFKRRIVEYTDKKRIHEVEHRWLQMIKEEELGKRYYNLKNHRFGHWSTTDKAKTVSEKQTATLKQTLSKLTAEERKQKFGYWKGKKTGRNTFPEVPWNKGLTKETAPNLKGNTYKRSADYKIKMSESLKNRVLSEESKTKMAWATGKKLGPRTDEVKKKIGSKNSNNMKRLWQDPEYRKMMLEARTK